MPERVTTDVRAGCGARSGKPARTALLDGPQRLGQAAEHLVAGRRERDEILDAHADGAGDVDPRLDGDDVACGKRVGAELREARALVDLEADPVPEPVAEVLGVAGLVDDGARDRVDLL